MSQVTTQLRPTPRPGAIAEVSPTNPHAIKVSVPSQYDQSVANHELTHVYQLTRDNPQAVGRMPDYVSRPSMPMNVPKDYGYGGAGGLIAAQGQGKKVSDFNVEQQGDMVADYGRQQRGVLAKASGGIATPNDITQYANNQRAYHPYMQQLANMPGETGGGFDINARPAAPGLPSANTPGLGVLQADPLMAGYSQPIPTPSAPKTLAQRLTGKRE